MICWIGFEINTKVLVLEVRTKNHILMTCLAIFINENTSNRRLLANNRTYVNKYSILDSNDMRHEFLYYPY